MIEHNIEFHNVMELEAIPNVPGLRLRRFPASVRNDPALNRVGREGTRSSRGTEIRFVSDGPIVRVTLSSHDRADGRALVFRGDYFHAEIKLPAGAITTFDVRDPGKFSDVKPECFAGDAFSPVVWRIHTGLQETSFHAVDAMGYTIRPPTPRELPSLRWLAYGSSITDGGIFWENYVNLTAARLGVDPLNCGLGGGCYIEKSVADFLAHRGDWDFATVKLGTNMRAEVTHDEFRRRAEYLLRCLLEHNPGRPVVVITIITNGNHFSKNQNPWSRDQDAFDAIVGDLVYRISSPHLHIVNGRELSPRMTGYSADLVHPFPAAYMLFAERLAKALTPILANYSQTRVTQGVSVDTASSTSKSEMECR